LPFHEVLWQRRANIWIVGGGDLAGQFYDHGLLDELFAQVGSVTLGAGKPLFPRPHQSADAPVVRAGGWNRVRGTALRAAASPVVNTKAPQVSLILSHEAPADVAAASLSSGIATVVRT
jgi:hypothetical protein